VSGRIAREKRDRLSAVRVRVDREERGAVLAGEDAAGLEEHGGGAGNVPERGAMVVHERERAGGHVQSCSAVDPNRRSR